MADIAPTQAFPPWLVPVVITTTINGQEVVQTSISQAPLTYFGPSIPLGDGWVFGSSTFPPSIELGPTSTSITPTSTSSSFSSSSSSLPSAPSSSSPSPSISTSSPKPTSTPVSFSSGGGLPLVGKILIPIFVVIVVIALLLLFYACYWRRRNRNRNSNPSRSTSSHLSDWEHIDVRGALINGRGDQDLEAGQGEQDAFLAGQREMEEGSSLGRLDSLMPTPWKRNIYRKPVRPATDTSSSEESGAPAMGTKDSNTSSTDPEDIARLNASGSTIAASSLFFNPARRAAADETGALRHSSEDPGAVLGDPHQGEDAPPYDEVSPSPVGGVAGVAIPRPPRTLAVADTDIPEGLTPEQEYEFARDRATAAARARSSHLSTSAPSTDRDVEERAALLTAQRVNLGTPRRVEILAPQTQTSPQKKKSASSLPGPEDTHDYYTEGYMADEKRVRPESMPPSGWLPRGILSNLSRFSWFRRMEAIAGPSRTRRSTPSSRSRSVSRHPSGGNLSFRPSSSRPHSGLLHPGFGSRPVSGYSFLGVDPTGELGMRPPGMRISGTGSTSAVSGGTMYHTASSGGSGGSRSGSSRAHGAEVGEQTVRAVDVLDIPAPETTLPLRAPEMAMSRGRGGDAASSLSSRMTESSPSFPPGLVNVQMWDKQSGSGSGSSTSNRDRRLGHETLDDAPPRAQGDWSSLRTKASVEEGHSATGRIKPPSTGERAVEVTQNEGFASEVGSILSGQEVAVAPRSPPPAGFGFSLTPRVSMHAISDQSGSHSSRPSHHTAHSHHTLHSSNSHSQELSHASSLDSEEGYFRQGPTTVNRVSLSAVGGNAGAVGPPQLPPIRRMSAMPTSPITESEELDRSTVASETGTRHGTEEWMLTRSETLGSMSTGTPTTVLGAPLEEEKE